MKTYQAITTFTMCLTLAFLAGCGNKEGGGAPTPPDTNKVAAETGNMAEAAKPAAEAVQSAVEAAKPAVEAAQSTVEAAKPAVEQAVQETKQTANTTVADATAKVNSLIDQAKTLMGQNKYTDALNTLQQLSSLKLTPEQEQLVTSLKEQIQKAMAAAEGTAVGNLLKK